MTPEQHRAVAEELIEIAHDEDDSDLARALALAQLATAHALLAQTPCPCHEQHEAEMEGQALGSAVLSGRELPEDSEWPGETLMCVCGHYRSDHGHLGGCYGKGEGGLYVGGQCVCQEAYPADGPDSRSRLEALTSAFAARVPGPPPAEDRVTDLMGALEDSVNAAKTARVRSLKTPCRWCHKDLVEVDNPLHRELRHHRGDEAQCPGPPPGGETDGD